jgi:pilus assembly protein CpaB
MKGEWKLFNRFNKTKILLLILCLIIAGGITYWQYNYFSSQNEVKTAKVIMAAKSIKEGSKLKEDMLTLKEIPISDITKNMILKVQDVENMYAKIDINEGTYLSKEMLSNRVVPIITEDMRRVTIKADMIMSLAGKVKAGDYVDIGLIKGIGEGDQKNEEGAFITEIIAEKVQIYSVVNSDGSDIDKIEPESSNEYDVKQKIPSAITFVVTPEQALLLKDSEAEGNLFLIGY